MMGSAALPPLTPRKTTAKRTANAIAGSTIAKLLLPAGNELLIRGIVDPTTQQPRPNPVRYVEGIILGILRQEKNEILNLCPVEVSAFSNREQIPACYVSFTTLFLCQESGEPRFDLMELWRVALMDSGEQWEVAW